MVSSVSTTGSAGEYQTTSERLDIQLFVNEQVTLVGNLEVSTLLSTGISRELHQETEFEACVAMGLAQHGLARDAHRAVN